MKVHQHLKHWGIAGILVLAGALALTAWTGDPKQDTSQANLKQDTVPSRQKVTRQAGDKDLDYELRKLDEAQENIENINWNDIQLNIDKAMKNIDLEKINLQVQEALQKVDFEKIQRDVEASLRKIDFDKIQQDIALSLEDVAKVDMEEVKLEIARAKLEVEQELARQDWKKEIQEAQRISQKEVQQELAKAQKEMEKAREEIKLEKLNFDDEMKKARQEIDKAREELKSYQSMIYAMEKDGLLNTKEDYTIEYRGGELLVNGKNQPSDVVNKYKSYFKKDKVRIEKKNGKININNHQSDIDID